MTWSMGACMTCMAASQHCAYTACFTELLLGAALSNEMYHAWPLRARSTKGVDPTRSSAGAAGVSGPVPGLGLARCAVFGMTAGGP